MRYFILLLILLLPVTLPAQSAVDELLGDPPAGESNTGAPEATPGTPVPGAPESTPGVDPEAGETPTPAEDEDEASAEDFTVEEEAAESSGLSDLLSDISNTGLLGTMIEGGLFMWPILLMGILALGVIIERYRSLSMLSTDTSGLRTEVQDLLQDQRVEDAVNLCDRQEGPVAAVLSAGLRKYLVMQTLNYDASATRDEVNKAMEDYSIHIVAALERHLPILATISSVAPMLGFLGTVAGMITSFKDIQAKMGEMNIVEAAASGISVALLTTCFGLIVGIPTFMAYNYFTGVINRNVLDVEESATELIDSVTMQMALSGKGTA